MSREIISAQIQNIFRDIFDAPQLIIYDKMSALDIEDWDSLNHINLISAIQQEFGIKFDLNELQHLTNVGALIDAIIKKTNEHN